MQLEISSPGKPTVKRTGNEFAAMLRTAFPNDSVDIALMNLDMGKTMEFSIKGITITAKKVSD